MASDKKTAPSRPADFSRAELVLINNALNEVCHGLDFSDDELRTRLGGSRKEIEKLLAKVSAAIGKEK